MLGIFPYRTDIELKKIPTSTLKFILACSLVHIITWRIGCFSPDWQNKWFEFLVFSWDFPPSSLSSIFVHADFGHLFFNMFFFWLFAGPLEVMEGKKKFWKLVIFSAFFSDYFSFFSRWLFYRAITFSDPMLERARYTNVYIGGIGASGVLSAFMGAYLFRFWKSRLYVVLSLWGLPVKRLQISPWIMILIYWLLKNIVKGVLFQGIFPVSHIGYFAHLGGFICGFFLAWRWGFHKNMRRDWLCQQAEELAKAPYTGSESALKTYQQALEQDPENGEILLEIARLSYFLGEEEKSEKYYRKAIIRLFEREEELLARAYTEAVQRFGLIFLSEKELELVRILLKIGQWQLAQKSLENYISALEERLTQPGASSLYIRANLILAYILDHYLHHQQEAKELILKLAERFPGHSLLKYPLQRLEVCGEEKIFYFNPEQKSFPFIVIGKKSSPSAQPNS